LGKQVVLAGKCENNNTAPVLCISMSRLATRALVSASRLPYSERSHRPCEKVGEKEVLCGFGLPRMLHICIILLQARAALLQKCIKNTYNNKIKIPLPSAFLELIKFSKMLAKIKFSPTALKTWRVSKWIKSVSK
jgi:hypothetical protein